MFFLSRIFIFVVMKNFDKCNHGIIHLIWCKISAFLDIAKYAHLVTADIFSTFFRCVNVLHGTYIVYLFTLFIHY